MPSCDVLIIGSGIMGAASAYHIKKNNPSRSVLLIDRFGAPAQGNTGRSNAMFRNTFSSSDNQILSDASIDFYRHVQNNLKVDIGLQEIGYLWLMSERQFSESEKYIRRMQANHIEIARYSESELKLLLPGMVTQVSENQEANLMALENIDGGYFGPKCGRLAPDRLAQFYCDEFVRMGGRVAFNTEAKRLLIGPAKRLGIEGEPFVWQGTQVEAVEVEGAISGAMGAKTIVLACGAWNNELLGPVGIDGHVKSKKRQLFSVSARTNAALETLLHAKGFNELDLLPMVILPKAGVHFKPVSEESTFWVACEDEANRPYIDIPDRNLDSYKAEVEYFQKGIHPVLSSYFPCFSNAAPRNMWAGLYGYNTLDNLPYVFMEQNLVVVGGDSGSGIMKADSLGRVVDAVYREGEDAMAVLHGNVSYKASRLSFKKRDVEREEWIL